MTVTDAYSDTKEYSPDSRNTDLHAPNTAGFLRLITRQRSVRQKDGTWRQVAADKVLEKAVTQPLGTYIYRRQVTVTEWVALRPILEVYDRDTGYKGGGRLQEPWWRQTEARKYLSATLKEILVAARGRRRKSSRRGESKGGDR